MVRIHSGVPLNRFRFCRPTTHRGSHPLETLTTTKTVSKRDFLIPAVVSKLFRCRIRLAGLAVELLQGVAFHLKLHLRIPFEDLRVRLAQHLCYPFVSHAADLVEAPYRGFTQALIRARIPYLPVNIDDDLSGFAVLILPNLGALSNEQCEAVRRFAQRGGTPFCAASKRPTSFRSVAALRRCEPILRLSCR